jgi:hypothetical protein
VTEDDDELVVQLLNGSFLAMTDDDDNLCTDTTCIGDDYKAIVSGETVEECDVLALAMVPGNDSYGDITVSCISPLYEMTTEIIFCDDTVAGGGTICDDDDPITQMSASSVEFSPDTIALTYAVAFTCCPFAI